MFLEVGVTVWFNIDRNCVRLKKDRVIGGSGRGKGGGLLK